MHLTIQSNLFHCVLRSTSERAFSTIIFKIGLLGDSANLLELSNMLDGLGGSQDFVSKRRMDVGDDDADDDGNDDDRVERKPSKKLSASVKKSKGRQLSLNNEVGDLNGLANLGDLTTLLEMLTSESKNKEVG